MILRTRLTALLAALAIVAIALAAAERCTANPSSQGDASRLAAAVAAKRQRLAPPATLSLNIRMVVS